MKLLWGLAVVALAGCQMSDDASDAQPDELRMALSGMKVTSVDNPDLVIFFGADGTLSGVVEGTWTTQNGQYCRTLTAPERIAGSLCQDVALDGDLITFLGGVNGDTTWRIEPA